MSTTPRAAPRRADPAIAVPVRLAVTQAHAVDHAVAGKPVVGLRVDVSDGIRPIAQVPPVEMSRDSAGDGVLVAHGRVVAFKVVVTHRMPLLAHGPFCNNVILPDAESWRGDRRTPASLPPAERQPTLGCAVGAALLRG